MGNSFSRRNAVLVQTEGQVGWAQAKRRLPLPNTSCSGPLLHCYIAAGGGLLHEPLSDWQAQTGW